MELFRKSINWTVTERNDWFCFGFFFFFPKFYLFASAGNLPLLLCFSNHHTAATVPNSNCQLLRSQSFYRTCWGSERSSLCSFHRHDTLFFLAGRSEILIFTICSNTSNLTYLTHILCHSTDMPYNYHQKSEFSSIYMRKHVLYRQIFKIVTIHLYFPCLAVSGLSSS